MVQVRDREVGAFFPASVPPTSDRVVAPRRRLLIPTILQIFAMIGIGSLVYSSAADWFATLHHNAEISGYVQEVAALPNDLRESKLAVARSYNSFMPQGVLRDPYGASAESAEMDTAYRAYTEVLNVSDNGVIGELSYPRLDIGLPVYHGTSATVLERGVGHLYGSSLPIGGPSTHSVLTSHSGLVHASLFSPLTAARVGDAFTVDVLGETHHYRVDQIETVLPEHTEGLRILNGEDFVTLITCTPTGINSHRLLVRGVRVDGPTDGSAGYALAGDGKNAGLPWWALVFLGGSAASAYVIFVPARSTRDGRDVSTRRFSPGVAHA